MLTTRSDARRKKLRNEGNAFLALTYLFRKIADTRPVGSNVRRGLLTLVIATIAWLPFQAKSQSVFTGIDGGARTSAQIDATVTRVMHGAEVPGLALGLINHGKVVYLKAYGVKNMSPKEPLTVTSVMVVASLTKVAFAYLV